jgi:GNAT superfamily N-acetyltransferase
MYSIRPATLEDAAIIAAQRRAMFFDMGYRDDRALDDMAEAFLPWLRNKMKAGEYLAWLAIALDGSVAAGAGLWLMDWPPHMVGPGARRGNLLNVYTRPDCRRHGLARQLTEAALDWCRAHAIRAVILHASDHGRDLYRTLGFQPTNEMRLTLEPF